ncbi:hypothetical protein ABZ341_39290 [Streptomyces sp. NPDC006173]|uniref:hypothetical protein n=1 Tax=Streptomyces sp. NPDC006173 TaxID=3155349 RepID=UPI003406CF5E
MSDEPTNGELARRLDAGFDDIKEDVRTLAGRLDSKVDVTLLDLQQSRQDERAELLTVRVSAIEEARKKEAEAKAEEQLKREAQRAADRRLILTSLVVPLLLIVLQVYLASQGAQ